MRHGGRDLDGGFFEFFSAEHLSLANVALVLLLIDAHVVSVRTKLIRKLNVTRASYFARDAVKERKARVGVTSSRA